MPIEPATWRGIATCRNADSSIVLSEVFGKYSYLLSDTHSGELEIRSHPHRSAHIEWVSEAVFGAKRALEIAGYLAVLTAKIDLGNGWICVAGLDLQAELPALQRCHQAFVPKTWQTPLPPGSAGNHGLEGGDAMTTIEMEPITVETTTKPWWKRPAVVAAALAIIAAVAVGTYLVMDEGSVEPVRNAEGVYERVAAALEEAEPTGFTDLTHGSGDVVVPSLMGWQINVLRLDPVFSNCIGTTVVTCDLTYGEDYFYSVVLGFNVEGSITVQVAADATFRITQWPFPEDLKQVEYDLRSWVRATHPELETRMFGNDAYGVFKFTEEALRLHANYLDEYMIYLGA